MSHATDLLIIFVSLASQQDDVVVPRFGHDLPYGQGSAGLDAGKHRALQAGLHLLQHRRLVAELCRSGERRATVGVRRVRGRAGLFGEAVGSCTYQVLCHGVAPVLALPDRPLAKPRRR